MEASLNLRNFAVDQNVTHSAGVTAGSTGPFIERYKCPTKPMLEKVRNLPESMSTKHLPRASTFTKQVGVLVDNSSVCR